MNPFDLFDDSILLKNTQNNNTNNSVHPEVDTTLEDTLLAEILDLDPLSPRKPPQIHTPKIERRVKNKENIPPQTTLSPPKNSIKQTPDRCKIRKINPFYSPSKHTKSLVAKDTLRKQLHFKQTKAGFLTHHPTPPSSSHSPSINNSSNR